MAAGRCEGHAQPAGGEVEDLKLCLNASDCAAVMFDAVIIEVRKVGRSREMTVVHTHVFGADTTIAIDKKKICRYNGKVRCPPTADDRTGQTCPGRPPGRMLRARWSPA